MDDVIAKMQSVFGLPAFPDATFYQFEAALRFELGGEVSSVQGQPIKRFLQAVTRAVSIAEAVFSSSTRLTLMVCHYDQPKPKAVNFRGVEASGLTRRDFTLLASVPQGDADYAAQFGEDLFLHHFVYSGDAREILADILWLALAKEMPIIPKTRWLGSGPVKSVAGAASH